MWCSYVVGPHQTLPDIPKIIPGKCGLSSLVLCGVVEAGIA